MQCSKIGETVKIRWESDEFPNFEHAQALRIKERRSVEEGSPMPSDGPEGLRRVAASPV